MLLFLQTVIRAAHLSSVENLLREQLPHICNLIFFSQNMLGRICYAQRDQFHQTQISAELKQWLFNNYSL